MSNYWQKRFQAVEAMNNKTAKETVQAVTPAFDQAQAQIEKEINAWYARFAKNNQISLQEAKKLLNTKELKEFRWDVEEYIKYGRQNAIDQQWMKQLENASARFHISRLEALKIRTQNAAERAFGNELDQIDQMVTRIYMDDYYHTAYEIQKGLGIGWDVSQIDQRKLDRILSKPWTADKMTFSDRIWKSKTQLIDSLHKELTQMCVLGKAPDQAISNIAKRMNVSKGQAGRLVMTEAAYFGSAAQKDCFNDLDVEKYEIVATLDSRTSEMCQEMDGKVFEMSDFQAGVTAPPFHVWCRSCTCPWFEDNDGERIARDVDGKTYKVPANMKYQDWKDHFVDKIKDPADWLKVATVSDIVEAIVDRTNIPDEWKLIQGEHSLADDIKSANPKHNTAREYNINCQRCVPTWEMRRRGFDVEALPYKTAKDAAYTGWKNIFENAKWDSSVATNRSAKTKQMIIDKMIDFGDGATGEIYVCWKGGSSAHVFGVINDGGTIKFVDPQTGSMDCSYYFNHIMPSRTLFLRMDDLTPSKLISDCCKPKGGS